MRLSGSVKLRCALPAGSLPAGLAFLPGLSRPSALRLAAAGLGLRPRRRLGLGLQVCLGRTNLAQPLLLSRHPGRQLVAALVCPELTILLEVDRFRRLKPARHLGRQLPSRSTIRA